MTMPVLMINCSGSSHESVVTQMRQAVSTVSGSRGLRALNTLGVGQGAGSTNSACPNPAELSRPLKYIINISRAPYYNWYTTKVKNKSFKLQKNKFDFVYRGVTKKNFHAKIASHNFYFQAYSKNSDKFLLGNSLNYVKNIKEI